MRGQSAILRTRFGTWVTDDYCEFNVRVLETTTAPPSTFARRSMVGMGTDSQPQGSGVLFGEAEEVDTGDQTLVDFARIWAGSYEPRQVLRAAAS